MIYQETFNQRQHTTKSRDVDDDLDIGHLRWRRKLFLDGGDKGDIAEDHSGDRANSVWEVVFLEKDSQREEGQKEDRNVDGGERVQGIFVQRNDKVDVLVVLGFRIFGFVSFFLGFSIHFVENIES